MRFRTNLSSQSFLSTYGIAYLRYFTRRMSVGALRTDLETGSESIVDTGQDVDADDAAAKTSAGVLEDSARGLQALAASTLIRLQTNESFVLPCCSSDRESGGEDEREGYTQMQGSCPHSSWPLWSVAGNLCKDLCTQDGCGCHGAMTDAPRYASAGARRMGRVGAEAEHLRDLLKAARRGILTS